MAEQAEVKTEKTPGAERIARQLGKEWELLTNYNEPPESMVQRYKIEKRIIPGNVSERTRIEKELDHDYPPPENYIYIGRWVGENLENKEELLRNLERMKTEGKIQDFEIGLPAFKVDGSELPFMRAAYVQHPPQEKPSPQQP